MNQNIAIIIINWNGAEDTIECLESVLKSDYLYYNIYLIDNNSNDDSANKIISWMNGDIDNIETEFPDLIYPTIEKPIEHSIIYHKSDKSELHNGVITNIGNNKIFFILNSKNLGFAGANNLIIKYLTNNLNYEYIFLLNNDTVISKSTISNLIHFMNQNNIDIANSLIYDYYNKQKITFAGGRLFPWGKAKYYYTINNKKFCDSQFAHGCALMVNKKIFQNYGVFSEKFFHGEEDFEFSWRMKEKNISIVSLYSSSVFHKEGVSVKKYLNSKGQKITISVLNRIVDMKYFYKPYVWKIWKNFVLLYYIYLYISLGKYTIKNAISKILKIKNIINNIDTVDKNLIDRITREEYD